MPTLPPTLLSTWEMIVVGIWIKGMPRRKVAAASREVASDAAAEGDDDSR